MSPVYLDVLHPADVEDVEEAEREAYALPVSSQQFRHEFRQGRGTVFIVVRQGVRPPSNGVVTRKDRRPFPFSLLPAPLPEPEPALRQPVIAHAGILQQFDEAHITTIVVRQGFRGQGFGDMLMIGAVDVAHDMRARSLTLEVRVSNTVAQNLYKKFGFVFQGVRKHYYRDNQEDAYIMTTPDINDARYRELVRQHRQQLAQRLGLEAIPDWRGRQPIIA